MSRYASKTEVPVEKSQAELKRLLSRYGADGFMLGERRDQAVVQFAIRDRVIKFSLTMPDRNDDEFRFTQHRHVLRSDESAYKAWEQACRQRWRALCLFVRATLEAVEEGVVDFEDAMMPFTVLDGRETFAERYRGEVKKWLDSGSAPTHLSLPGVEESGTQ